MRVTWCWRCRIELPMLDEAEYEGISKLLSECISATKEFREVHGLPLAGLGAEARFAPALAEYRRLTGFAETNHRVLYHHRISLYGPPCRSCGKPLRTPRARRCVACGDVPPDVEQQLIDSVARRTGFGVAVEGLLSQLLSEVGYAQRPTDGVLFEREEVHDDGAFAFGVVVMIDQSVQPLRVALQLDASRCGLVSGLVQFGSASHRCAYGSAEQRRLTREILRNRELELPWLEQFRGGPDGWRRVR